MTLILEIEFLSGVCFAAIGPDLPVPDWPLQPDRVFSALVCSWAARGCDEHEAEALCWLEAQPAPRIIAGDHDPRTPATVFVPPNDPRSDRQKSARGVLPSLRSRQPRQFPSARLTDSIARYVWREVPPDAILARLQAVAADTAYVGHSASLTRCRFFLDDSLDISNSSVPRRRIYPGRLAELREAYGRFEQSASRKDRPQPGAPAIPVPQFQVTRRNAFGARWLILQHIQRPMPDIRACAVVARTIRDALMSGFERIGRGADVPEVLSGHSVDGTPSRTPHVAIVPLPFVGFPYADGHVLGFALVAPAWSDIFDDQRFREALQSIAPMDADLGRRVISIRSKRGTEGESAFAVDLTPTFESSIRSLDSRRYTAPARTFATVTPMVLDRHLKERGELRQREIEELIAESCVHIGLPSPARVVADKHSAIEGVPSAYPSGSSPAWMRWRLPRPLASRQLTHAVIQFDADVEGPLLLGAGRYVGLGLCQAFAGGGER